MEAEVIVHSELSDAGKEKGEEADGKEKPSPAPRGPLLSEDTYSPLRKPAPSGEHGASAAKAPHGVPSIKSAANRNGELEARGVQLSSELELPREPGMTNGFHSPKDMRSVLRSDHLENRDSRHRPLVSGKVISAGMPPAPFVSSGLVHPTSAAHTYLCP